MRLKIQSKYYLKYLKIYRSNANGLWKENTKRNKKYLKEFEKWLNKKGLANKTIRKHLNNTELFINDYLNYYDITKVEDGLDEIFSFLNG